MPSYFYNESEAAKRSDIDRQICVSRKPYFMIYRYQDIATQYRKYRKKADMDCLIQFGCTIDELMERQDYTEEEENFLHWYKRNSPVSLGNCTMNQVCRRMELELDKIDSAWAAKVKNFNYSIYRTNNKPYSVDAFIAVGKILDRYEQELKSLPNMAKANRMDATAIAEYRAVLAEEVKVDCYCQCSGSAELCSILLDRTYGAGKPSQIAWDICGDVIIRNLLEKNGGVIHYYEQCDDGEVEYAGVHFTHKELIVEEDINDDRNE